MANYDTEELVSSSKLVKNFGSYMSKISTHEIDKIGILKNNKLDAVIISPEVYDLFEDFLEHIDIYNIVKDRIIDNEFIEGEELMNKFGLSVN